MKPFYIHKQTPRGKFNGFTVKVEPTDNQQTVKVAVAFCSRKDAFCKSTGRDVVEQQSFNEINKRQLPKYLEEQWSKCYGRLPWPSDELWYYVLKYAV